jgi:hypothetical protein
VRDDILRGERTTLTWPGRAGSPLAKRPGMEGPISSVIATPFAVVVGTSSADPAMRQRCREKADAFRTLWSAWQHCAPRVLDDTAVTAQDEQQYSLVLIGGADANVVTRRWSEKLPLRVDPAGIDLDGRRWDVRDAVAQMIYPSPANAERCVLVVAATSADGMYFWNPALWNGAFGYPTVWSDWTIQDGRRLTPGLGNPIDDAWVASGLFDAAWRRDDRWTIVGDPAIRDHAALRRAPSAGFRVEAAALERCAGAYELAPGVRAIVTRRDDRLEMRILGGAPIALHAEGEFEYANDETAMPVAFERDDHGEVVAAVLCGETGAIRAPRVK